MTETTTTASTTTASTIDQPRRRVRPVDLMTDADAEALRSLSSNDLIDLPENRLPCATCGVPASPPSSRGGVIYADVDTYGPRGTVARSVRVPLGLCSTCADLPARAVALVAAHPALTAALGAHRAIEAAEGVLTALALLDKPLPHPVEDKRLGILVRNLSTMGLSLRYRQNVTSGKANPYPWAHVRNLEREALRSKFAAVLSERVALQAPPVKITPPPIDPYEITPGAQPVGGACGICGVAHISVAASTVARSGGPEQVALATWTLHGSVSPASLGAGSSPARLLIWLCPTCEEAGRWVGSMGPSTLERALFSHLDRLGSLGPDVEVPGLVGWAGLCADALRRGRPLPKPGRVPWDHVDVTGV